MSQAVNKRQLEILSAPGFESKVNTLGSSGKPYTIKVEISDNLNNTYSAEFDILEGGLNSDALRKGITACFVLCEGFPMSVTLRDACYMATA